MTPNKERIKLLVDALRSGEYNQVKGKLRSKNGYCCLGVACEVFNQYTGNEYKWNEFYDFMGCANTLPPTVMRWFGFENLNPTLHKSLPTILEGGFPEYTLAGHNDSGASFEEIADLIEKEFLN